MGAKQPKSREPLVGQAQKEPVTSRPVPRRKRQVVDSESGSASENSHDEPIRQSKQESLPQTQAAKSSHGRKINSQDSEIGITVATDAVALNSAHPIGGDYRGKLPGMGEHLLSSANKFT